MLNAYERHRLVSYAANALRYLECRRHAPKTLVEWLREHAHLFEGDEHAASPGRASMERDIVAATSEITHEDDTKRESWRRLRRLFDRERDATEGEWPDQTSRYLQRLGDAAGLSSNDVWILEVLLYYETHPIFENMMDALLGDIGRQRRRLSLRSPLLAIMLGFSANKLRSRLTRDAPLIRCGLVTLDFDQELSLVGRLHRLTSVVDDRTDVRRLLFGETRTSDLEWGDFDHLGQSLGDLEDLLQGALQRGARGVNVLLYGPPGTGKTSLCHVLAECVGAQLVSIGECDEDGGEPSRSERLEELKMAQCLFGEDRNTVLLFDEMDDLLSQGEPPIYLPGPRSRDRSPSKVFLNRLLEETRAPILWTTNEARHVNAAILRRVTYAVEMRQPPPRIRARIWERQLARHGIEATPADALALAHEFDASPGVAAGAATAADLCTGDIATVRRGVRSLSRLLGRDRPPFNVPTRFDPSLFATNVDLDALTDRLERNSERRFSICLDGPPGTGKSAFVRYLADRLGLEVVHKRASDLLGMFVGQTEKNIADAFTEAREDEAFLIFDEADSLLADRRDAYRSWEISQVNEMLTWMESHPLPFACTTNYGEKLDSAVLRRFVFKVTLGYLTPDRAATAFRSYFGLEPPRELAALQVLTPGDFAVVRRKAEVLGQLRDAHALTAMLRAECDAKPDRRTAIGFGNP